MAVATHLGGSLKGSPTAHTPLFIPRIKKHGAATIICVHLVEAPGFDSLSYDPVIGSQPHGLGHPRFLLLGSRDEAKVFGRINSGNASFSLISLRL